MTSTLIFFVQEEHLQDKPRQRSPRKLPKNQLLIYVERLSARNRRALFLCDYCSAVLAVLDDLPIVYIDETGISEKGKSQTREESLGSGSRFERISIVAGQAKGQFVAPMIYKRHFLLNGLKSSYCQL